MRTKLKSILALLAMLSIGFSSGFHVVALQGIAWVKMYSQYSEVLPASEAFELTFSGKELCGICLAADDIREDMNETLDDFTTVWNSFVLAPIDDSKSIEEPTHRQLTLLRQYRDWFESYQREPASPPPRSLTA